ncbi:transcription termination factor NusA [Prochlorococcus sp. AH-716-A06]|nr:transcription termination factor NusA [Prochlorococcus sp. AH-716-A06]
MALVILPGLNNLIEDISEEKKLPPHVVESALREALLKGYEKYRKTFYIGVKEDPFDDEYFSNFDVGFDLEQEGYRILSSKIIVENVESEDHQISLQEVKQVADDAQIGDTVVLDVTPEKEDFGRMAASTTKQVLAQKLRDQQRKMIQEEFADLEDPVLTARVIRFERQSVIMGVSSGIGRPEVEAELPKRDQLPNDNYRANATFKVFLKEVSEVARKGPQLFVSRANAGLVVYLFENEVPEIQEGTVKIVAVSREANPPSRAVGPRTKVAVDSIEREVDPVGACIGARGARIQQVVNELRGEKIDVIKWSSDPIQYILNSLSPAKVDLVRLVDPEGQHAHVLVPPDQLSLAIGREGQNVRLAARLTGWKIDVKNSHEYDQETEDSAVAELIVQREEEENLQREAEQRLEAEQAERAAEDKRLRELYPLPEDDEEYGDERYDEETLSENDQIENLKQEELLSKEENTR